MWLVIRAGPSEEDTSPHQKHPCRYLQGQPLVPSTHLVLRHKDIPSAGLPVRAPRDMPRSEKHLQHIEYDESSDTLFSVMFTQGAASIA